MKRKTVKKDISDFRMQFAELRMLQEETDFLAKHFSDFDEDIFFTQLLKIQKVARDNCIFLSMLNEKEKLTDYVTLKEVFDSLTQNVQTLSGAIGDAQIYQRVTEIIKSLYINIGQFADAVRQYLTLFPKQSYFFTNIVFPAVSGHFISEESLVFGYEFINELMAITDISFVAPFIVIFYNSSFIFINVFWSKFIEDVEDMPHKPSLNELFKVVVRSLSISLKYFTPYHSSLTADLFSSNIETFSKIFFMDFLLSTYKYYAKNNPSLMTNMFTYEQLKSLFAFVRKNTNSDYFQVISKSILENLSSVVVPMSFVSFTGKGQKPLILSTLELSLILDIVPYMTLYRGKQFKIFENKSQKSQTFMPCSFVIYFAVTVPPNPRNIIFKPRQEVTRVRHQEHNSIWSYVLNVIADEYIQPLHVLQYYNINEPTDNQVIKKAKAIIAEHICPELIWHAVRSTKQRINQVGEYFEAFLSKRTNVKLLDDYYSRVQLISDVYKISIAKKFYAMPPDCSRESFSEALALSKIRLNDDAPNYLLLLQDKDIFDHNIQKIRPKNSLQFRKYVEKNEKHILLFSKKLNLLDQMSLGERLWVIADVIESLMMLDIEKTWFVPLFILIFYKSKATCFFQTFIAISKVKTSYSSTYTAIYDKIQDNWREIVVPIEKMLFTWKEFPEQFVSEIKRFSSFISTV